MSLRIISLALRPAEIAARWIPRLRSSIETDRAFLERLPGGPILPLSAVAVPFIFTLLRTGVTDVYTESFWFLILSVAIGFAAPSLGILLFASHVLFDIIRSFSFSWGLLGRATSFWLLWLLVVEIPLGQRAVENSMYRDISGLPERVWKRILAGTAALATGTLLFIWSKSVPLMLRPIFTWKGEVPTDQAFVFVQSGVLSLILGGCIAAVGFLLARCRWGQVGHWAAATGSQDSIATRPRWKELVNYGAVIFLLSGIISGFMDVVLLAIFLFVSKQIAFRIAGQSAVRRIIARTPYFLRFVAAFAITFIAGRVIVAVWLKPVGNSEFFPVILTVGIGIIVFRALTDAQITNDVQASSKSAQATLLFGVVVLVLLLPIRAYCNNCADLRDCFGSASAAAAAGAGAGAAGGWGTGRRRPGS